MPIEVDQRLDRLKLVVSDVMLADRDGRNGRKRGRIRGADREVWKLDDVFSVHLFNWRRLFLNVRHIEIRNFQAVNECQRGLKISLQQAGVTRNAEASLECSVNKAVVLVSKQGMSFAHHATGELVLLLIGDQRSVLLLILKLISQFIELLN